jgi:hypothetical protein
MTSGWEFPSNNRGAREGFNSSGIAIFAGDVLQSFVREAVQNSLDARMDKTKPVNLTIELSDEGAETPSEIKSIAGWLLAAQEQELKIHASTSEGRDFYKRALDLLSADSGIRVLGVHDFNTTGLTGPTVDSGDNDEFGGWLGLVKGSGMTIKNEAGALGSFGQGAKAPFALSALRTVFYLTKVVHGGRSQVRFQGKCIFQSLQHPVLKELTQATGFYGKADDLSPLLDDSVPRWAANARESVTSGTGTSVFVAAPRVTGSDSEFWFDTKIAILSNFYFAIKMSNLTIRLGDGTTIDQATIGSVYEDLNLDSKSSLSRYSDQIVDGLESVRTIHNATVLGEDFGVATSKTFGDFHWFLRTGEDVPKKAVGIARQNGMLITRSAERLKIFRGVKPFDLFVCVIGDEGSSVLRQFENPEHNTFQFDRVADPDQRKVLVKKYEVFADEVKELVQQYAGFETLKEDSTNDLNHLLGGSLDSDGTQDLNEMSIRLKVGKKGKKKRTEGERSSTGTGDTGPGRGVAGGEGVRQSTGGSLPGGTGEGAAPAGALVGVQVKNLRVVQSDSLLGDVDVYFTPTTSGSGYLRLFRSGETDKEPIAFEVEGKPVTAIAFTNLTSSRKHIRIKLSPTDLTFALEGMLTNEA